MPAGPEFVRPPRAHQGPIHLAAPDATWARQYAEVAARIREALGSFAVVVEHVGSTSVPGLAAKPFIDVLLLVADPSDEAAYVPGLEAAGFLLHVREPDWHQHRFFRAHDPEVQVHVFAVGSAEAQRMLLFRDRLRANPDDRKLYEETKRQLAARSWARIQDYADAKSDVVEEIIARAGGGRLGTDQRPGRPMSPDEDPVRGEHRRGTENERHWWGERDPGTEVSMEPISMTPDADLLEGLRRHRAELRESMGALEAALAAPAAGDRARWAQRVHVAAVELAGDFREHVDITEGPDGLYREVLTTSPRLSGAVSILTHEHALIRGQVDSLLTRVAASDVSADADKVRDLGTALLGRLVRHRQRGADLVFEAYEFDIGGET
jgi:GrpB-like predicted nucleotidyltransferase (UPF0157 family)